jgi:hypothetical protein
VATKPTRSPAGTTTPRATDGRAAETQARYRRPEPFCVGDPAPEFELERLDAETTAGGPPPSVRLASFRGARPVVLCFGSYT